MFEVKNVSDTDVAFGGDMKVLMPPMSDIPKEFHDGNTKWNEITSAWFFGGLSKDTKFYAKEGINPQKALKHIKAILGSYAPRHEEKEASVAFLLSEWFMDITDYQ